MNNLPRHSVSVTGVVIREDGRILAIKRTDDGRWVPPGGVLELNETPENGVRREVREETGIDAEPIRLTGVYKNMNLGVVTLAFLCRPSGGVLQTSDESSEVTWLAPDEAQALMPEARAVRVADALRPGGPFVRVHDGSVILA